jgi:histidyl-tRNA synthetase
LVACGVDMLRAFGLTHEDIIVRFSDRRVLNALLQHFGLSPEQVPVVYGVFDKIHRTPEAQSIERLMEAGVALNDAHTLVELAQHGTAAGERVEDLGERVGLPEIATLVRYQQEVGFLLDDAADNWLKLDLSIVRGLAYYTGVVFEIFDRKGQLRAICGGGRYDGLLSAIGGVDLPALGFGMGDVVLGELLRDRGLMPKTGRELDFWVAGDDAPTNEVLRVVGKLRQHGRRVEYALREQSLGAQLKAAARGGAAFVAIVRAMDRTPPQERVVVRRLADGAEQVMGVEKLVDTPPGFIFS